MNTTISVIVPIYNVEPYLERCIQSIVKQTYSDLEIILVNDGSPDRCGEICDLWKEKDSRIKVVHKINGGLSDARNAGLELATGDYIGFVDSDDWIDSDMYEVLMQTLLTKEGDIAACGFRKVADVGEYQLDKNEVSYSQFDTVSALKALITEQGLQQVVWNKLYKRSVVDGILFEKGKYNEDEFWSYQVIGRASKVVVVDNVYYNYFFREDSIINTKYSLKRLDGLEGKENRQFYIDMNYPMLSGTARLNLYYSLAYAYQCSLRLMEGEEQIIAIARIEDMLARLNLERSDYKQESVKQKLWLFLYRRSMKKTCELRNRLKKGL